MGLLDFLKSKPKTQEELDLEEQAANNAYWKDRQFKDENPGDPLSPRKAAVVESFNLLSGKENAEEMKAKRIKDEWERQKKLREAKEYEEGMKGS